MLRRRLNREKENERRRQARKKDPKGKDLESLEAGSDEDLPPSPKNEKGAGIETMEQALSSVKRELETLKAKTDADFTIQAFVHLKGHEEQG